MVVGCISKAFGNGMGRYLGVWGAIVQREGVRRVGELHANAS